MTAAAPRAPKLLLVDDDPGVLAAMTAYFEMVGIDIVTTSSPFEVPFLIGREAPDVVLMDVGMPVLDGTKIIDSLRTRIRLSTHFILFSGRSRRDLATLTEELGATDCISKGEDMASIERRVRFWMNDTQRRSA